MWRQLVNRGQSFRSAGRRCSRRCTVQRGSWFPLLCPALNSGVRSHGMCSYPPKTATDANKKAKETHSGMCSPCLFPGLWWWCRTCLRMCTLPQMACTEHVCFFVDRWCLQKAGWEDRAAKDTPHTLVRCHWSCRVPMKFYLQCLLLLWRSVVHKEMWQLVKSTLLLTWVPLTFCLSSCFFMVAQSLGWW